MQAGGRSSSPLPGWGFGASHGDGQSPRLCVFCAPLRVVQAEAETALLGPRLGAHFQDESEDDRVGGVAYGGGRIG